MLNKRIRGMIDDIFSELKMTAENLALRDELLANAQARYEDSIAQGKSEEEAFAEVAQSLDDVQELLHPEDAAETAAQPEETAGNEAEPTAQKSEDDAQPKENIDFENALNKTFRAIEDIGQQLMPTAKKLVREADKASGGMLRDIGRAVNKGMRGAKNAADEVIDRMTKEAAKTDDTPAADADWTVSDTQPDNAQQIEELLRRAGELRQQAEAMTAAGDADGASLLQAEASACELQAEALRAEAQPEDTKTQPEETSGEAAEPTADYTGIDGELDADKLFAAVDEMAHQAEETIRGAAKSFEETIHEHSENSNVLVYRFPALGLRQVDVHLDSDDVVIEPAADGDITVTWSLNGNDSAKPVARVEDHTLILRRKNPDMFKTLFSVFNKEGGKVVIAVPRGYAANYEIHTTSGDIRLSGVDADEIEVNSTSGSVRVEPDTALRTESIDVNTVSGAVTISACAEDVDVNTVSGSQFVSCDAGKVDAETVSGAVHIEGACDEWEVNSVSGEIELIASAVPTRSVKIGTVSGSCRLALPGEIRGFVAEVSGVGGGIVNEFGPNRYGTCALPIRMETMSGKLMITRL